MIKYALAAALLLCSNASPSAGIIEPTYEQTASTIEFSWMKIIKSLDLSEGQSAAVEGPTLFWFTFYVCKRKPSPYSSADHLAALEMVSVGSENRLGSAALQLLGNLIVGPWGLGLADEKTSAYVCDYAAKRYETIKRRP